MVEVDKKLLLRIKQGDKKAFDGLLKTISKTCAIMLFLLLRTSLPRRRLLQRFFTVYGVKKMKSISGYP